MKQVLFIFVALFSIVSVAYADSAGLGGEETQEDFDGAQMAQVDMNRLMCQTTRNPNSPSCMQARNQALQKQLDDQNGVTVYEQSDLQCKVKYWRTDSPVPYTSTCPLKTGYLRDSKGKPQTRVTDDNIDEISCPCVFSAPVINSKGNRVEVNQPVWGGKVEIK